MYYLLLLGLSHADEVSSLGVSQADTEIVVDALIDGWFATADRCVDGVERRHANTRASLRRRCGRLLGPFLNDHLISSRRLHRQRRRRVATRRGVR